MDKKANKKERWWVWPGKGYVPLLGSSGQFGEAKSDIEEKGEPLHQIPSQESYESEGLANKIGGSLSIYAIDDPKSFFDGLKETYRYLDTDLAGDEWGALFFGVLGCSKAIDLAYYPGEDSDHWRERVRQKFEQSLLYYPLLSRIWDIDEYVHYGPEEISELREVCLKVQIITSNEMALNALEKLVVASDEALARGLGLLLVPD